jgi:L-lactate utilization protein LutB
MAYKNSWPSAWYTETSYIQKDDQQHECLAVYCSTSGDCSAVCNVWQYIAAPVETVVLCAMESYLQAEKQIKNDAGTHITTLAQNLHM